jgi:hypothetical protein
MLQKIVGDDLSMLSINSDTGVRGFIFRSFHPKRPNSITKSLTDSMLSASNQEHKTNSAYLPIALPRLRFEGRLLALSSNNKNSIPAHERPVDKRQDAGKQRVVPVTDCTPACTSVRAVHQVKGGLGKDVLLNSMFANFVAKNRRVCFPTGLLQLLATAVRSDKVGNLHYIISLAIPGRNSGHEILTI